jgi:hypothetical protein
VELFAAIRRDARVEELSIRELADKHHVHRRTVRQALGSALPPARKPPMRVAPMRVAPKLEPFKAAIDAMLTEDPLRSRAHDTLPQVTGGSASLTSSASQPIGER